MTSVQGLPWRQALLVYFLCPGPELCSGDCLLVRPGTSVRPPCHSSPSLTFCQGPRVWPHKFTVGPCGSNTVRPPASCRARFKRCLRALGSRQGLFKALALAASSGASTLARTLGRAGGRAASRVDLGPCQGQGVVWAGVAPGPWAESHVCCRAARGQQRQGWGQRGRHLAAVSSTTKVQRPNVRTKRVEEAAEQERRKRICAV